MKVLHVITRLILGGAQENTLATVYGLMRKGYDVTLATGPPLGPEGSLIEEARERGVRLALIPEMRREIHPLRDAKAFVKLYRLIKNGGWTIVHTHSSKAGILGRLAARAACTRVIVHTIHGLPFHPYQSWLLNLLYISLEKIASLPTHKIITVCDAMREAACRCRIAGRNKFTTIYSGMELDPFLGVKEKDKGLVSSLGIGDNMVIGKIARLFPLKGQGFLIRALPDIIKAVPDVKLLLVGDGILKEPLMKLSKELDVRDRVIFAGLVKREEIARFISVMDVVVHTSLREGLARVLPQAMAAGKPVVSFNLDGAGEVVLDGQTGFLVSPGDMAQLQKKIIELAKNPRMRLSFGRAGRKLVEPIFRAEYMVERICGVYEGLAG